MSETQEEILSEESADGETVAGAIKEIIEAAGQMDEADEEGIERLQEYIAATQEAFDELGEEAQDALSESIELLGHATAAVDSMQDVMEQISETGSFTIEQTGLPNSWRYINGVRIEEAIETVEEEMSDVAALPDEKEKQEEEASETPEEAEIPEETVAPADTLPEEGTEEEPVPIPEEEVPAEEPVETETEEVLDLSDMTEVSDDAVTTAVGKTLKGIDISRWNWGKPIEWAKVKNAVDYVIIQCGYGNNETSQDDRRWAESVAACEKYGIPYGVYLYSYATTDKEIDSEVAHTLRLLKGHHPSYPVYLDLEENAQRKLGNAKLSALATRYCSKIKAAGYKTGVYSSTSWWNDYLYTFAKDKNYYHWVAHWAARCGYTGRYEMWQFSDVGKVNGISGDVDLDYWYGETYASVDYGIYEIVSAIDQNYALDIAGGGDSDGVNVRIYKRNNTFAQKFYMVPLGYGNRYYIVNANSGKYLDVKSNGKNNGTNVWQYTGNNTEAQVFQLIDRGNGKYEILAVASGKYLDVAAGKAANGTNVQIYSGNHTAAQNWYFVKTKDRMPTSGAYEIQSSLDRDAVLDIKGGSLENKANVQLYHSNGTAAQRFYLRPLGYNDLYYIINVKSEKSLDVQSNGTANGTNVWQYTPNDSGAQIFRIIPAYGGSFEIQGLGSGKFLDAKGGSVADGTNVQIYEGNGTPAQRWFLNKITW